MKKFIYVVTMLAFLFITVNYLGAQPKFEKGNKKGKFIEKLNLTDSQKEKVEEIRFNFEESKIELEAKIKRNRLEIRKMIKSNSIDESALMKNIDKGSALFAEKRKFRAKMWLDIRNILDDNQKKIWAKSFRNLKMQENRFFGKHGKRGWNH